LHFAFCILNCFGLASAAIPLATSPSWSSISNDYSTGGGFADIDTNGYIDFCTSNGNDMAQNTNTVYFNHNGVLEGSASWRSSDSGYFGHLYLGDVDNDSLIDMAVAYLGPGGDHRARIYRNIGGKLSANPWWESRDTGTSFDCCLGDVNNDGYLDLVVSAGNAYTPSVPEPLKIYFNHAGVMDTLPGWQSDNLVLTEAVRFADLNNDGKLDLIAAGNGILYVYYQHGDSLERTPSWVDTVGSGLMGVRLAVADYDNDGWLDLAAAFNGQLGGNNCIRIYHNHQGVLEKPPAFILQRHRQYSSCIAWADANGDLYRELAAGGWWEPVVVYENHAGVLDTIPDWSWSPADSTKLVCESVMWGDLRNAHLASVDEAYSGDGTQKLFRLDHVPLQGFSGVDVNSVHVPRSDYCVDLLTGYVSMKNAPPNGDGNVVFHYVFSEYPDLGVVNWEPTGYNHVFFNTTGVAVAEQRQPQRPPRLTASGSFLHGNVVLSASVPDGTRAGLKVFSTNGRLVGMIAGNLGPGNHSLNWAGSHLTPGAYFIRLSCGNGLSSCCKILVL